MEIIDQYYSIMSKPVGLLHTIEKAGRTCYKSENKINDASSNAFVQMLINRGHHAMIEFGNIVVRFITNRGVTHEMVRHRLCSFAQESTRYVNYSNKKHIQFIKPVWSPDMFVGEYKDDLGGMHDNADILFTLSCMRAEAEYNMLIDKGWRPEQAREVLPNAVKTEIVVQANIREWRHIFKLRTSKAAHPQMRALMLPLLEELREYLPVVFDDI